MKNKFFSLIRINLWLYESVVAFKGYEVFILISLLLFFCKIKKSGFISIFEVFKGNIFIGMLYGNFDFILKLL